MIKILRKINWIIMLLCLAVTWLPYFNILNSETLIVKIPEPLAITIFANIILTVCCILLYPLYYIPFYKSLKNNNIGENENE